MPSLMTVDDYAAIAFVPGDHRFAYGELPDQFGEIYLPAQAPSAANGLYPVVILIHGGCWRDRFGLEQIGQMARRLNESGMAVWSLEYRRIRYEAAGDEVDDQPRGLVEGWPMVFLDVAAGADHVRNLATAHRLDLNRVIAVGHSAGGHLALWLGARRKLPSSAELYTPDPVALCGVVSLAGIPDLGLALDEEICSGAPAQLMGGTPQEFSSRYAEGSPAELLPLGIRHCHLVGRDDEIVPVDYLQRCVARAQALGDKSQLHVLPYAAHFEVIDAGSDAFLLVEQQITQLLKSE